MLDFGSEENCVLSWEVHWGKANIEHRTPNFQRRTEENQERKMRHSGGYFRGLISTLDGGWWMFAFP
jgi:hypothetical protein